MKVKDFPHDPFVTGVIEPELPPSAGTLECYRLPREYLPYVQGALAMLTKPRLHLRNGATFEQAVAFGQWFSEFLDMFVPSENCDSGGVVMGVCVGQIIDMIGIPEGCGTELLLCDGSQYAIDDYPELYAVLQSTPQIAASCVGSVFEGNFRVPNLSQRFTRGSGIYNVDAWAPGVSGDNEVPGDSGGLAEVPLTVDQLPAHSHNAFFGTESGGATIGVDVSEIANFNSAAQVLPTGLTGAGEPHSNLPPFFTVLKYIVAKVESPMAHSFQLRQNPTNPYLLEQSVDGGAFFDAFDYELIKQNCGSGGGGGGYFSDQTIINNYVSELTEVFTGDITTIYVDGVYGVGGAGNDLLRDNALCWVINQVFSGVAAIIEQAEAENNKPDSLDDLIDATLEEVTEALGLVGAGSAAVASTGGWLAPYAAAAVSFLIIDKAEALTDRWLEFFNGSDEPDRVEYSDDLVCCIYSSLQGETISQSSWNAAVNACLLQGASESAYGVLMKELALTILTTGDSWPVFLDQLQVAYTAQQAGVILPCPCVTEYCNTVDFRLAPLGSWTVHPASEYIEDEGIYSLEVGDAAGVEIAFTQPVVVTSVRLTWRRPKSVPPGSNGNAMSVWDTSPGAGTLIYDSGSTGVAGETVTEVNNINRSLSSLRMYAQGSQPEVANQKGLIYAAQVCWQGAGVPVGEPDPEEPIVFEENFLGTLETETSITAGTHDPGNGWVTHGGNAEVLIYLGVTATITRITYEYDCGSNLSGFRASFRKNTESNINQSFDLAPGSYTLESTGLSVGVVPGDYIRFTVRDENTALESKIKNIQIEYEV